jgi:glycosyltransferase involved in cell wall biosynthesis
MKMLLATGLFPPEIGGPATYAQLLVERLPALGIDVEVLPFSSVRRLPRLVRHFAYVVAVLRRARVADLVFVQDAVSTGLPVLIACTLLGKKYVLRVPGDYAWEQGVQRFSIHDTLEVFQTKRYGIRVEVLRNLQQFVARRAARVIVSSSYFSGIVRAWGMPEDRLVVMPNAVTTAMPRMPLTAPAGNIVITGGRFVPGKGFSELIDVITTLEGWHLVLAGDGPLREELESYAQKISNRVTFTGSISREEMEGWYRSATVFVLNSESETFSFQVLEAMAAGVPVISTDVGALPELVENGVEGVLVAPNDRAALKAAIESVVREPETWRARSAAGKQKAANFAPERMLEQFVSMCKKVI